MGLEHFRHEHSLILNEEHKDEFKEFSCCGCNQSISGPRYSCSRQCQFFLHKLCAELPQQQMQHPLHPEHPLTILVHAPSNPLTCWCDVCGEAWGGFAYHCSTCNFNVDIVCVLKSKTIEHRGHNHPLIPLQKFAMFFCLACHNREEDLSFRCTTCRFWILQKCASMPATIQLSSHHHHPLTLSYSLPPECFTFTSYCDFCAMELDRKAWVYYCAECRYHIHLSCATRRIDTLMDHKPEIEAEDNEPDLIDLPLIDESLDLVTQLIKNISLAKTEKIATMLDHKSHQHRLILYDVQSEDESRSSGCQQPSLLNEIKNDVICEGCWQPISSTTPFYSCRECSFFLHKWCAELPDELQHHPCHPEHPLVLVTKAPEVFGMNQCSGCARHCRGFTFSCVQCQFNLDVRCACLPSSIRHEAHKEHHLILRENLGGQCTVCDMRFPSFAFICQTCNFKIHAFCALLPRSSINHRYDNEHPFCLSFSPIKDISQYICEICERDVNPRRWFYHCIACDRSTHTQCLCPLDIRLKNIKVGRIIHHLCHDQPLKGSQLREDDDASCDCCGKGFGDLLAYECKRCSFKLHLECSQLPKEVRHECHKHLLTLIGFPIKGRSTEYKCEICKLEIDRKVFYHCVGCNQSVHVTCMSDIKLLGTSEVET